MWMQAFVMLTFDVNSHTKFHQCKCKIPIRVPIQDSNANVNARFQLPFQLPNKISNFPYDSSGYQPKHSSGCHKKLEKPANIKHIAIPTSIAFQFPSNSFGFQTFGFGFKWDVIFWNFLVGNKSESDLKVYCISELNKVG